MTTGVSGSLQRFRCPRLWLSCSSWPPRATAQGCRGPKEFRASGLGFRVQGLGFGGWKLRIWRAGASGLGLPLPLHRVGCRNQVCPQILLKFGINLEAPGLGVRASLCVQSLLLGRSDVALDGFSTSSVAPSYEARLLLWEAACTSCIRHFMSRALNTDAVLSPRCLPGLLFPNPQKKGPGPKNPKNSPKLFPYPQKGPQQQTLNPKP